MTIELTIARKQIEEDLEVLKIDRSWPSCCDSTFWQVSGSLPTSRETSGNLAAARAWWAHQWALRAIAGTAGEKH
jgi:hypothetical protein